MARHHTSSNGSNHVNSSRRLNSSSLAAKARVRRKEVKEQEKEREEHRERHGHRDGRRAVSNSNPHSNSRVQPQQGSQRSGSSTAIVESVDVEDTRLWTAER